MNRFWHLYEPSPFELMEYTQKPPAYLQGRVEYWARVLPYRIAYRQARYELACAIERSMKYTTYDQLGVRLGLSRERVRQLKQYKRRFTRPPIYRYLHPLIRFYREDN